MDCRKDLAESALSAARAKLKVCQTQLVLVLCADSRAEPFGEGSLEVGASGISKVHGVVGLEVDTLGKFLLRHPGRNIL